MSVGLRGGFDGGLEVRPEALEDGGGRLLEGADEGLRDAGAHRAVPTEANV